MNKWSVCYYGKKDNRDRNKEKGIKDKVILFSFFVFVLNKAKIQIH